MARRGVVLFAWWFLVFGNTGPPAMVGPFATETECVHLRRWLEKTGAFFAQPSWCWWDGTTPRG